LNASWLAESGSDHMFCGFRTNRSWPPKSCGQFFLTAFAYSSPSVWAAVRVHQSPEAGREARR